METLSITWRWPWAILLAVLVLLAVLIAVNIWARRKYPNKPLVHPVQKESQAYSWTVSDDLKSPKTASRYLLYRRLSRFAAIILAVIGLITALLMGRPSQVDRENTSSGSRDIVLCLDVSGSALAYDRQIIAAYLEIIDQLQGERIGLSIFDSTSRTVFPLTDDYDVIQSQLKYGFTILQKVSSGAYNKISKKEYAQIQNWLEGTRNITNSSSLIGDGLVSCALQLPQFSINANDSSDKKGSAARARNARSASIIFATDNVQSGKGTYSLTEAMSVVTKSGISVDGLYIGPQSRSSSTSAIQMKNLITHSGGVFVDMNNTADLNSLVQAIEKTSSGLKKPSQQANMIDRPQVLVLLLILALAAYLLTARRLRR